jgi:hypothetical protein
LPKGVGDILNAAFTLYKDNWKAFFKIVAIVAVPLVLVTRAIIALSFSSGSGIAVALGALLAALAAFLISNVLTGAITRAGAGAAVGLPVDVDATFKYALARLGSILWISLLAALAVLLPIIVITLLFAAIHLVVLAILIDIALGFFLFVKFAAALPSLIVEDRRGTDTLSRSWELTAGHFWHVLGALVVAAIITGIVGSILQALFGFDGWVVQAIGGAVSQIVTAPFTALVTILLYLDLRARKESLTSEGLKAELARSA